MIVLAEDHEDTRRVYTLILQHYGYQVAEAVTGRQAVEVVRATRPDLVLMDIGLPVMNGRQAGRVLKADPDTRFIPLIAFSARVDSIADLADDSPTFDGYILKPIGPLELVRRVAAYLELFRATPVAVPVDDVPAMPFMPEPRFLDDSGTQEQSVEL